MAKRQKAKTWKSGAADDLLTTMAAGRLLGVDRATVYRWLTAYPQFAVRPISAEGEALQRPMIRRGDVEKLRVLVWANDGRRK
jgi:hypothetical protein